MRVWRSTRRSCCGPVLELPDQFRACSLWHRTPQDTILRATAWPRWPVSCRRFGRVHAAAVPVQPAVLVRAEPQEGARERDGGRRSSASWQRGRRSDDAKEHAEARRRSEIGMIVVVTSCARGGDGAKAFAAGADAYVTRPFRQLLAPAVSEAARADGGTPGRPIEAAPVSTRVAPRSTAERALLEGGPQGAALRVLQRAATTDPERRPFLAKACGSDEVPRAGLRPYGSAAASPPHCQATPGAAHSSSSHRMAR
jgi:CheY-like chemotaxis protein